MKFWFQQFCFVGNGYVRRCISSKFPESILIEQHHIVFFSRPPPPLPEGRPLCNIAVRRGDTGFPYRWPQHHHSQNATIISELTEQRYKKYCYILVYV